MENVYEGRQFHLTLNISHRFRCKLKGGFYPKREHNSCITLQKKKETKFNKIYLYLPTIYNIIYTYIVYCIIYIFFNIVTNNNTVQCYFIQVDTPYYFNTGILLFF